MTHHTSRRAGRTASRFIRPFAVVSLAIFAGSARAEPVLQPAENNVPVSAVEVVRGAGYTEVRLQTREAISKVCWFASGPDSPFLVASGKRYRLLGGDNIANCPAGHDYAARDIMALRFEPLPAQVREFSLVEGDGGESQMLDPKSRPGNRFWNFLHIKLN
jgi:hypothetical protein